jgi:hypothetical protein
MTIGGCHRRVVGFIVGGDAGAEVLQSRFSGKAQGGEGDIEFTSKGHCFSIVEAGQGAGLISFD